MSIDLIIPEPSAVVKTNELLLGIKVDSTRIEKVRSCFSSYYYELTEEQIASIINALIKNHCFLDANKRTAFLTFISICNINNITNIKDKSQYATIFENIAANHYTVQEVAKLLFTKI